MNFWLIASVITLILGIGSTLMLIYSLGDSKLKKELGTIIKVMYGLVVSSILAYTTTSFLDSWQKEVDTDWETNTEMNLNTCKGEWTFEDNECKGITEREYKEYEWKFKHKEK